MFLGVPYVPFFLGAGSCVLMAAWFNLFWLLAAFRPGPPQALRGRSEPVAVWLL